MSLFYLLIEVRYKGEKIFVNHFMEIVMRQDDKTCIGFLWHHTGAVSQSDERGIVI